MLKKYHEKNSNTDKEAYPINKSIERNRNILPCQHEQETAEHNFFFNIFWRFAVLWASHLIYKLKKNAQHTSGTTKIKIKIVVINNQHAGII